MKNTPKSETIIFNGIPFRRYPNSRFNNHRNYYSPSAKYIKKGMKNLHVEIWKSVYGEVPSGCEIHHKDGNALNNSIENLECLTKDEHYAVHSKDRRVRSAIAWHKTEKFRNIHKLAVDWHSSEEGLKWHRQHGKDVFGNRPKISKTCEQCGTDYLTTVPFKSRFCSNKCKAKCRRDEGIDNVTQKCERCGNEFISNRYERIRFCSKFCSARSTAFFSRERQR